LLDSVLPVPTLRDMGVLYQTLWGLLEGNLEMIVRAKNKDAYRISGAGVVLKSICHHAITTKKAPPFSPCRELVCEISQMVTVFI